MNRLKLPEPDNTEISNKEVNRILHKYFNNDLGDIDWLISQSEISLNQIEHLAKLVSENLDFFKKEWPYGIKVGNAIRYGIDALRINLNDDFHPSRSRQEITNEFRTHLFLKYKKKRKKFDN